MQTLTAVTCYISVFLLLSPLFGRDPPFSSSSSLSFTFLFDPSPLSFRCPDWLLTQIWTLISKQSFFSFMLPLCLSFPVSDMSFVDVFLYRIFRLVLVGGNIDVCVGLCGSSVWFYPPLADIQMPLFTCQCFVYYFLTSSMTFSSPTPMVGLLPLDSNMSTRILAMVSCLFFYRAMGCALPCSLLLEMLLLPRHEVSSRGSLKLEFEPESEMKWDEMGLSFFSFLIFELPLDFWLFFGVDIGVQYLFRWFIHFILEPPSFSYIHTFSPPRPIPTYHHRACPRPRMPLILLAALIAFSGR